MADVDKLKKTACQAIDDVSESLNNLSQEIWNNPELNYEEHHAHDVLTTFLQKQGFQVDTKYKLDTAFCATAGEGAPNVAVLCEYDALPEIGHACGHNLIAEVGAAAGVGIKAALETAGKALGKLIVLGTPAEEGGGGKNVLLDQKVFTGVDFAMMCHPGPNNVWQSFMAARERYATQLTVLGTPAEEGGGGKDFLLNQKVFARLDFAMMCHPGPNNVWQPFMAAIESVTVTYRGRASHAAAFPWEGVNALDAAVMCYQTISCLRQQMKPTWRVHGIITNGGAKPNIIPEVAVLEYYIRAPNRKELKVLREKIVDCFESAAKGTGCTVEYKCLDTPYLNVINNMAMVSAFEKNARALGIDCDNKPDAQNLPLGSTDMGNVSYVVPSIHPFFYIGSDAVNHTREFTTASGDSKAQPYTIKQAKALAMTAIDILTDAQLLKQIKSEFENEPMRKE